MSQTFSLQPFPAESLANLKITGNIARHANTLVIHYTLSGDLKQVVITPPANSPARKHQLWENTCFEFFISIKNSQQYWEFNLSPSGHWNVYRFDDYRQGMQEETAFITLPFSVQNQSESLTLALDVDLNKIVSKDQNLEVAITTVIKHKDDEVTYWALTHQGTKADFHLRNSFIIDL
ncbi:DOMON-like domain-containing protein [Nostocaceae cyanobacterium CENA369]|uniref:DOMON-like domain-containing protein n=1 Tax=Dendronalium phyllosphericum CENA369 TaxID=1725256 RepID=A0A8J7ID50_9NOST|nr:DOMON-like domain-containing protein [Dendronalium phyllosphericum]MBH8575997.1 DOMON-like domain-containing protein [Dendronalium phyllosphericum CENA369]